MIERDPEGLTPTEREAQKAVRALREVPADPDFRQRLRADFVRGSLRSPWARESSSAWGRLRERLLAGGAIPLSVAGLAVAMILLVVWSRSSVPHWELQGASGEGTLWIDGRAISSSQLAARAPRLQGGTILRTDGQLQIEIVARGKLAMQAAPGATFYVPGPSWTGHGAWRGAVQDGEVRCVTGPDFSGRSLLIDGTSAAVEVTGTTLAIIAGRDSTCVCVFEGTVRQIDRNGRGEPVAAGMRRTVYSDRRKPLSEAIRRMESMKLSMLVDRAREFFPRP